MKAPDFEYIRAATTDDVFEAFDRYGDDAQILAGGQSLMATLNLRLSQPAALIDINGLPDLEGIRIEDNVVRIGALTRHATVGASAIIARHVPLIAMAMPHVAHLAIRNRGTFGGSLALADPAAELPACLLALAGDVVLLGPDGRRTVAARDFFKGLYETDRRADELLVEARIPVAEDGAFFAFSEFSRRHGDFAQAGIACKARIDTGKIADMSLVSFAAEECPRVIEEAREAAIGAAPPDAAVPVGDAVRAALDPMESPLASGAFKREISGVLAARAIGSLST